MKVKRRYVTRDPVDYLHMCSRTSMYNEGPRDWQYLFAKLTRFRYIEIIFHTLYYYWGKENHSLYQGLRYKEVRYIEVPLFNYCNQGAITLEQATPKLRLRHGVFTDRFIFRYILEQFFPQKWKLLSDYEDIQEIGYEKRKLNVIKRSKISFSGQVADWFVGLRLKMLQIRAKIVKKN